MPLRSKRDYDSSGATCRDAAFRVGAEGSAVSDVGPATGGPRSPCPGDSVEELCQCLSARGLAVDRALCVSAAQLFAHTSPQESASKTATAALADTNASATRNGNHGNDGFCLWFPSVPVASSCPSGLILSQRLPPVPVASPSPSGFPQSLIITTLL